MCGVIEKGGFYFYGKQDREEKESKESAERIFVYGDRRDIF